MHALAARITRSPTLQVLIVLATVAGVQLPMITRAGFSSTEGHRVVPGWEMLETGDLVVPHMFGRVYLRKPPGIAWAIAGTAALLGESELSARLVSVCASAVMALLAFAFTARWLGPPWGLVAGLAQALLPMFWPPGRSAEIEALNNMATMAAALAIIDLAITRGRTDRARAWPVCLLLAAGIATMAAVKGPAGAPTAAGALIACAIVARSPRPVLRVEIIGSLALGAGVAGLLAVAIARAIPDDGQLPMTQSVGAFLWGGDGDPLSRAVGVGLLLPRALLAGLPLSAGVLLIWISPREPDNTAPRVARACALTWIIAIAILMAAGVDNHRYTMVAMVTLAPLAAATIMAGRRAVRRGPARLQRLLLLDRAWIWAVALIIGAGVFIPIFETGRARRSGLHAGNAVAEHLPDGARVLADHLVEARPEVLLYARRAAARDGRDVTVLWIDHRQAASLLRPGDYVLVRTDERSDESRVLDHLGLRTLTTETVHEYTFQLRRAPLRAAARPPGDG